VRTTVLTRTHAANPVAEPVSPEGWEGAALIASIFLLFAFGLVALFSASAPLGVAEGWGAHGHAVRQLGAAVLGVTLMVVLAGTDYRHLRRFAWPLLIASLALLAFIVLPWTEAVAPRINGARRWLVLGVGFQPSELAKIALVVWTAALAVKKQERLRSFRYGFLPFLVVWGAVIFLVSLQPDMSAALLLALLSGLVLFAAGGRLGHFALVALTMTPVLWLLVSSASYRLNRIVTFLDPASDPSGVGYQIYQSLVAVGSGGLTGVGFGRSLQKYGFLPEPHNDFIFALIAEEWGLLGVLFFLGFFAGIAWLGYRIAMGARDLFGYLLAIGMTAVIVVPAILHMGVTLALLPATGVPLPFVSYGRSALLASFMAVGILLSVLRYSRGRETA